MREVTDYPHAVQCIEHTWIPMRDGTRLAARIFVPTDADQHPVPAVLEYIPYRKRDDTRLRDDVSAPYIAGHGYAYVRVDLRGSGDSEGLLLDEYLEQEIQDGLDVLAWIADQPWCDGGVGMIGISWGGFNGLQIAARQPPELKAVVSLSSSDDRYLDDVHYMGGCLLTDNMSWAAVMFAYNSCPPDPAIVGDSWREQWMERLEANTPWIMTWLAHQHRDEYWRRESVCEDYDDIQVPVMAVSGWADGYTNTVFRLLENLSVPRQGLVGPWSHLYPHLGVPGPAIGFLQEQIRWWDHWMKGIDRGVEDEPMLRAWMQDNVTPTAYYETRPGRWVGEREWPAPDRRWTTLRLAPSALVDASEHVEEQEVTVQSPLTVGLFAGKWCSYSATPDLPHDQRQEDGGALTFDSPALAEDLEILGAPVLDLEFTSNRPCAMVAVRLSDIAPDDKATRITYGILNLTHGQSHEEPEPLRPGERYHVQVPLNHVAQRFPAGHRLRVAISTSYWPLAWPPAEPVRLGIRLGASSFTLPVRPRRDELDTSIAFPPPEGAPQAPTTLVEPTEHSWRVIRDLATDESTLEVVKDEGAFRIDDIGTTMVDRVWEWCTNRSDQWESPRSEIHSIRGFRRDDWSVETHTRTVVTCTATEFNVRAELDAYENDKRVFSRNWDENIPRNLL
ncbi:MAG: CocE/NonD family hydrolase [Acidimicrobiales bacterium]|nr:CocE/NonD family hydrolase [Acidimicrobiales bacterium]